MLYCFNIIIISYVRDILFSNGLGTEEFNKCLLKIVHVLWEYNVTVHLHVSTIIRLVVYTVL